MTTPHPSPLEALRAVAPKFVQLADDVLFGDVLRSLWTCYERYLVGRFPNLQPFMTTWEFESSHPFRQAFLGQVCCAGRVDSALAAGAYRAQHT